MIEIQIPKLGMSTIEVEVVEVFVKVGEEVAAGDELMEVEGDKSRFTVETQQAGTVAEVLVAEGDECNVGDIVIRLTPS